MHACAGKIRRLANRPLKAAAPAAARGRSGRGRGARGRGARGRGRGNKKAASEPVGETGEPPQKKAKKEKGGIRMYM